MVDYYSLISLRYYRMKFMLHGHANIVVLSWQILTSLWWIYLRIRTCGYLNDPVFLPLHCHCHCPQKTIMMISRHGNLYSIRFIIARWIISHHLIGSNFVIYHGCRKGTWECGSTPARRGEHRSDRWGYIDDSLLHGCLIVVMV